MTNEEIIQAIKAEIERLKDENNNIRCDHNKAYCQGYGDAFVDLLPFLDTLESEKPTQDELELNSLAYLEQLGYTCIPEGAHTKKPIQEGLEEEYKDYVESDPVYSKLVNRIAGLSIARHFAEWGAEHLKK